MAMFDSASSGLIPQPGIALQRSQRTHRITHPQIHLLGVCALPQVSWLSRLPVLIAADSLAIKPHQKKYQTSARQSIRSLIRSTRKMESYPLYPTTNCNPIDEKVR